MKKFLTAFSICALILCATIAKADTVTDSYTTAEQDIAFTGTSNNLFTIDTTWTGLPAGATLTGATINFSLGVATHMTVVETKDATEAFVPSTGDYTTKKTVWSVDFNDNEVYSQGSTSLLVGKLIETDPGKAWETDYVNWNTVTFSADVLAGGLMNGKVYMPSFSEVSPDVIQGYNTGLYSKLTGKYTVTYTYEIPATPVSTTPEPATLAVLGLGFAALPFARRFRNK